MHDSEDAALEPFVFRLKIHLHHTESLRPSRLELIRTQERFAHRRDGYQGTKSGLFRCNLIVDEVDLKLGFSGRGGGPFKGAVVPGRVMGRRSRVSDQPRRL